MKFVIALLTLLNIAILAFVYVKISAPDITFKEPKIKLLPKKEEVKLKKPVVYNFPAKVLYMKIDFRNYKKVVIYKVIVKIKDRFSAFNVKTILNNYNLPYTLFENGKEIIVFIVFRNLKEAKKILNLFKEYNFDIKMTKQIKRI